MAESISAPRSKRRTPHLRIVLSGAESSGKSTLTRHLGDLFGLPCAMEYARIYLEENGPDYTLDQVRLMAARHLDYQEREVPPDSPIGLYDTDLINYKIWTEEVFGECPDEIQRALERESHHAYLLCSPDLPWMMPSWIMLWAISKKMAIRVICSKVKGSMAMEAMPP